MTVTSSEPANLGPRPRGELGPSFDGWYRGEHDRVVGILLRLGADVDVAADVAAEAFSRALERWDRVGAMASPTGWTVAVALNLLRRRGRRQQLERRFLLLRPPPTAPAGDGDIWDVVRTLPNRQRTAVVLHYLLDLPYAEVAALMGISTGAVGSTLTAARERLAVLVADADAQEDARHA